MNITFKNKLSRDVIGPYILERLVWGIADPGGTCQVVSSNSPLPRWCHVLLLYGHLISGWQWVGVCVGGGPVSVQIAVSPVWSIGWIVMGGGCSGGGRWGVVG